MQRANAVLAGGVLLSLVLVSPGCSRHESLNEPASDFSLTDLSGKSVSLSGLGGHPVLLSFWALG